MGFNQTTNPELRSKVAERVARMKGDFSNEAEDATQLESLRESDIDSSGPPSPATPHHPLSNQTSVQIVQQPDLNERGKVEYDSKSLFFLYLNAND